MSATDDDRIAYLAGDAVESLSARERAELDELREALGEFAIWVEPDPELEDRIVAAIADEARAQPAEAASAASAAEPAQAPAPGQAPTPAGAPSAAPAVEPAGAPSAAPASEPAEAPALAPAQPSMATRPPRRKWNLGEIFRRRSYAFGGLAAAAAIALVAIVLVTGGKNSPKPLHFAMVVTGTPLAPRAKGTASLVKTGSGWRIELSVTELPHIQDGRYYQAWLKDAAGILVPVGTFNDAQHVTLWSGVPVTRFRTLTVTIQPANGNPVSSGKRVLTGSITSRG